MATNNTAPPDVPALISFLEACGPYPATYFLLLKRLIITSLNRDTTNVATFNLNEAVLDDVDQKYVNYVRLYREINAAGVAALNANPALGHLVARPFAEVMAPARQTGNGIQCIENRIPYELVMFYRLNNPAITSVETKGERFTEMAKPGNTCRDAELFYTFEEIRDIVQRGYNKTSTEWYIYFYSKDDIVLLSHHEDNETVLRLMIRTIVTETRNAEFVEQFKLPSLILFRLCNFLMGPTGTNLFIDLISHQEKSATIVQVYPDKFDPAVPLAVPLTGQTKDLRDFWFYFQVMISGFLYIKATSPGTGVETYLIDIFLFYPLFGPGYFALNTGSIQRHHESFLRDNKGNGKALDTRDWKDQFQTMKNLFGDMWTFIDAPQPNSGATTFMNWAGPYLDTLVRYTGAAATAATTTPISEVKKAAGEEEEPDRKRMNTGRNGRKRGQGFQDLNEELNNGLGGPTLE
jgi:hypothetical protein